MVVVVSCTRYAKQGGYHSSFSPWGLLFCSHSIWSSCLYKIYHRHQAIYIANDHMVEWCLESQHGGATPLPHRLQLPQPGESYTHSLLREQRKISKNQCSTHLEPNIINANREAIALGTQLPHLPALTFREHGFVAKWTLTTPPLVKRMKHGCYLEILSYSTRLIVFRIMRTWTYL